MMGLVLIRRSKAFWLFTAWLIVGFLGLSNYKQHVYSHYFGFLWPAVIILSAVLINKLGELSFPMIFFVVGFMLLGWNGNNEPNFQLKRAENVAQFIVEEAKGEPLALALLAKQNYDPPYRYFLEEKGVEIANLHETMPDQLFVICEPWGGMDCSPIGNEFWDIAAFGWAETTDEWQMEEIEIFRLIHYQSKDEKN